MDSGDRGDHSLCLQALWPTLFILLHEALRRCVFLMSPPATQPYHEHSFGNLPSIPSDKGLRTNTVQRKCEDNGQKPSKAD